MQSVVLSRIQERGNVSAYILNSNQEMGETVVCVATKRLDEFIEASSPIDAIINWLDQHVSDAIRILGLDL